MGQKRKHGGGGSRGGDQNVEDIPETLAEYDFVWSSGVWLRLVRPYRYCFRTFTKARWIGRALHEVCATEFGARTPEYYREAITEGRMKVRGNVVSPDYVLCNGDAITHETVRHEPPVLATTDIHIEAKQPSVEANMPGIAIVGKTEELVAVDKPPTMPVHPSGAYNHNTLLHILAHEQPQWRRGVTCTLHAVHRLDRLTSGLVLLATSPAVARRVCGEIADGKVKKEYLARVRGNFPSIRDPEHLPESWRAANVQREDSILQLFANAEAPCDRDGNVNQISPAGKVPGNIAVMGSAGSLDTPCTGGGPESGLSYASMAWAPNGSVRLSCPLRCVSHRDGVHECHPEGRFAVTVFERMGYDSASDTSLVQCAPLTGRTHQIRVHLQQLGFPIANDPNYGGHMIEDAATNSCTDINDSSAAQCPEGEGSGEAFGATSTAVGDPAPSFTEAHLRCRGIWLHAVRYSGPGFSFSTPNPPWAHCFEPRNRTSDGSSQVEGGAEG